jgi:N-acetylneuraminic acid mutarotase
MPTSRGALATTEVNGKIYAIGGGPASGSFLPVVEEYDPVTNTWIKKSNLIAARNAFSANVVNGEIYAIGGYAGVEISTVEKYDALLAPRRPPQGVDSKGKLATLWGRLKASN